MQIRGWVSYAGLVDLIGPGFLVTLWVLRYVIRQELQSNEAAEFGVLGLVDHTHAALAELLDNAVTRDGLVDHTRRILCPGSGAGQ